MPAGVRTNKTVVVPPLDLEAGYTDMEEYCASVIYVKVSDDKPTKDE